MTAENYKTMISTLRWRTWLLVYMIGQRMFLVKVSSQRMLGLLVLRAKGIKKHGEIMQPFLQLLVVLEAISRNIALEFAPFGIKSNCIEAGVTDTASFRMIPGNEKLREYAIKRNPFKRLTAQKMWPMSSIYWLKKNLNGLQELHFQ